MHVLINNAGIFPLGPVELLAEEVRTVKADIPCVNTLLRCELKR